MYIHTPKKAPQTFINKQLTKNPDKMKCTEYRNLPYI